MCSFSRINSSTLYILSEIKLLTSLLVAAVYTNISLSSTNARAQYSHSLGSNFYSLRKHKLAYLKLMGSEF